MSDRIAPDAQLFVDVLPATLAMGAGGGLTLPALASLGMSTATDRNAGLASGLLNTTQQVGGALGLAILISLARPAPPDRSSRAAVQRPR